MNNDSIVLTVGSEYLVRSIGTKDKLLETRGIFKGYTSIAGDEAMVIELDKSHGEAEGVVRVLPLHMIIAMDILKSAKEMEAEREEKSPMFG